MAAMFIAREITVAVQFAQAHITFVDKNIGLLADAKAEFPLHLVDFQANHGDPATRLDLFLDLKTKRVPWWRWMAHLGRSPHSRRRHSTPASGLIKDGEHGRQRSATVQ